MQPPGDADDEIDDPNATPTGTPRSSDRVGPVGPTVSQATFEPDSWEVQGKMLFVTSIHHV